MKTKKTIKSLKNKALAFADSVKTNQLEKAQQTIVNIENSTFFGILLKGLVNNWFSVLLISLLLAYCGNLYLQNRALENEALKAEITRLNSIVEANDKVNEELKERIEQLEDQKKQNAKGNQKYADSLKKLTAEQLQAEILKKIKALKKRRGMKG